MNGKGKQKDLAQPAFVTRKQEAHVRNNSWGQCIPRQTQYTTVQEVGLSSGPQCPRTVSAPSEMGIPANVYGPAETSFLSLLPLRTTPVRKPTQRVNEFANQPRTTNRRHARKTVRSVSSISPVSNRIRAIDRQKKRRKKSAREHAVETKSDNQATSIPAQGGTVQPPVLAVQLVSRHGIAPTSKC